MNPLPVTVSVCEEEPATTLSGVMDTIPGAGFAEFPGDEGGWGVLVEEWEPPPQPDKTRREPKAETPNRRSRDLRCTNTSKKSSFRSVPMA
jgi:hypothetical protein